MEMIDKEIEYRSLPNIGYIALIEDSPIAAGFIRRVEGNVHGELELYTNPFFGSIIQKQGIKKVLESLLLDAKSLKLKKIIIFSIEESTLEETKSFGFQELAKNTLALSLGA